MTFYCSWTRLGQDCCADRRLPRRPQTPTRRRIADACLISDGSAFCSPLRFNADPARSPVAQLADRRVLSWARRPAVVKKEADRHRFYTRIPRGQPYGSLDAMLLAEIGETASSSMA